MLANRNQYINSAYEQLQIISQDDKKRMEYEAREKAIRDYNQLMYESKQAGIQQGIQQGKLEKELEIAMKVYHTGWKINDISNLVGISTEILNEKINEFML